MSFRYHDEKGVGFYEAEGLTGARAIFTTRKGGRSLSPFDSLNLGSGGGDRPDTVSDNRLMLTDALGIPSDALKTVSQVHGSDVFIVASPDTPRPTEGYDALITSVPGVAVGILTADCVPILLFDPVARAVGAVHAGWAGTAKAIAGRTVGAMVDAFGSAPKDITAFIGPSIGQCCYEVDEVVIGPFSESMRGWLEELVTPSRPGHWFLDLWRANERVLALAGLRPSNIRLLGLCTSCNPDKFFSHRKSGGRTGRMMGVAMLVD